MNLFQIVALSGLSALIIFEVARLQRGPHGTWLVRVGVWLAAMIAVARPGLLQNVANLLGIGRGTDVLLYALVFAFFGTSFFLYARTIVIQRQMTQLARRYALDNARHSSRFKVQSSKLE